VTLGGLRVTSGAETLLAAARDLGLLDLVIMGDSALRLEHCTTAELLPQDSGVEHRGCGARCPFWISAVNRHGNR
jgi:hypothetical protein